MDQNDDPRELEHKIEQARSLPGSTTTAKEETRTRARQLWEQNGRPSDRDLEFWLQAEAEISERKRE